MLGENHNFNNSEIGIQQLFETINKELIEKNVFFSHLVIDGQEVFEEHEEYIIDQIDKIKLIEVKTKTIQEFVNGLFVLLNEYTSRAIPEIEKLSSEFYQAVSENNWLALNDLLEGIEWIYETIKGIDQTKHTIVNWDEFVKCAATIEVELPNLLEAIENKDTILIADIIQYEMLPQFQLINNETGKTFEEK
jgi:hypothetical protein